MSFFQMVISCAKERKVFRREDGVIRVSRRDSAVTFRSVADDFPTATCPEVFHS